MPIGRGTGEDGIRCPFGVADTPKATNDFITFGQKSEIMKRRFILYRRKRGGMFYLEDTETHKQETTGTRNRAEATALLNARNESFRQPQLNLQIAKAYLAGTDAGLSKRTWQDAFTAITENKHGPTQERWQRAIKQKAFDLILPLIIIETQAEQLFACLKAGTVSTNVHLRELHNFCIGSDVLSITVESFINQLFQCAAIHFTQQQPPFNPHQH